MTFNPFLPSYEDCVKVCDANDNFIFFESKFELEGYNVSIFAYRLSPKNFKCPIPGNVEIDAYEMRGITFVFNSDGTLYKRYLLMNKFFNLNQVEDTQYDKLKDLPIANVMNKEDGSVATFIKLPNGSVVAKSKASFISDQAIGMMNVYNSNEEVRNFVNWSIDNDIVAVFEYVGPNNLVVVPYEDEKLILLKMRCNKTGKYLNIKNYTDQIGNIDVAKFEDYTSLNDLMVAAETITDKEGWVVEFNNGFLVKIKTLWYFDKHSIYYLELNRENTLIRLILDEKIDDYLSMLDTTRLNMVNRFTDLINYYIKFNTNDTVELIKKYKGDIKDYVNLYRKEYNFPIASATIRLMERENLTLSDSATMDRIINNIDSRLRSETLKYERCLNWIETWEKLKN